MKVGMMMDEFGEQIPQSTLFSMGYFEAASQLSIGFINSKICVRRMITAVMK